ncbi:MAG: hypothetical protein OXT68_14805 [Chloroflexota bacterium]|nr:hypothetical protein [Chloroflexota bacterium]
MSSIPAVKTRAMESGLPTARSGQPADNPRLDWWLTIVSCFMIFGLFIDGWAHNHDRVDDSFFTPWHALLYSAYGVSALSLIAVHFRNVGKGFHWRRALPAGYMPALGGALLFATGGLGDMVWHGLFGIEEGTEALLSPTHLLLAASGLLIITGPVRALWQRQGEESWGSLLPAILALTLVASVFTFFTAFAAVTGRMHIMTGPRPEYHNLYDVYGVLALVVHSNILLGVVLFSARRWRLPFGAFTLMFTINALLMTWMHLRANADFLLVINAAIAGLLCDWLLSRNITASLPGLRMFSFLLPVVFSLGGLLVIQILGAGAWDKGGLWWEVHMWLGGPALAGAFGYGLSLLFHPPAGPTDLQPQEPAH